MKNFEAITNKLFQHSKDYSLLSSISISSLFCILLPIFFSFGSQHVNQLAVLFSNSIVKITEIISEILEGLLEGFGS